MIGGGLFISESCDNSYITIEYLKHDNDVTFLFY